MKPAIALIACYILGAIPFGLIIGKIIKGVDIRQYGSGNIGASNVLRTLGTGPALLVFVLDTAKGLVAVLICYALALNEYWTVAGALLSVFGHTFSVFLKFRGGKGVATSLGVIIGLCPLIAAVAFGLWVLIVGFTRYISLASILAAISVPIQMVLWKSMDVHPAYQILAGVAAFAIVLRHRSNIARLLSGREPKIGQKVSMQQGVGSDDDR